LDAKMLVRASLVILILAASAFSKTGGGSASIPVDAHVHILSPELIKIWKGIGIPFTRPDAYYSDINVILKNAGTGRIDLISMAHVFSSEEFGGFKNERELVEKENDYVSDARKMRPGAVRAFCSVDPLRDYALDELERCRSKLKMDGIKLHHNASQVYLTVPDHLSRVKKVFEFAVKFKLPILMHFDNSHRRFGDRDVGLLVDEILKDLDPVRLTIAHFGTSGGFNARTKAVIDTFRYRFRTEPWLSRHQIVFDISAVALDKDSEGVPKLTNAHFDELAIYIRRLGPEKISFGTDYPLYTADSYIDILRNRVGLSEAEISTILRRK
jgi:predicted TIM-barrel fold metal-dependent hydrolase